MIDQKGCAGTGAAVSLPAALIRVDAELRRRAIQIGRRTACARLVPPGNKSSPRLTRPEAAPRKEVPRGSFPLGKHALPTSPARNQSRKMMFAACAAFACVGAAEFA